MFSSNYWADLIERAIRASAAAVLALVGADGSGVIHHVDWGSVGTVAGFAALVSALVSLVGSQVGAKDSGSLLPANVDPPQPTAGYALVELMFALVLLVVAVVILFHFLG